MESPGAAARRPGTLRSVSPAPSRVAAVALALALAGCHVVRYDTGARASPRRVEQTVHFFFWGLVGGARVDLDAACPDGAARWRSEATFGEVVADLVTLGVWSPRTVVVECAEARR